MLQNNPIKNSLKRALYSLVSCLIIFAVFFSNNEAFAIYEGVREMTWSGQRCHGGGWSVQNRKYNGSTLAFDPFSDNGDINWDLSNQTCIAYIASFGTILAVQDQINRRILCKASAENLTASASRALEEAMTGVPLPPFPTPATSVRLVLMASTCLTKLSESSAAAASCPTGLYCTIAPKATSEAQTCCVGSMLIAGQVAAATTALAIIYGVAKATYEKARVCGHDWQDWAEVGKDSNKADKEKSDGGVEPYIWKKGSYKGSYSGCLKQLFQDSKLGSESDKFNFKKNSDYSESKITNKFYREYIYGGKEFEDRGSDGCTNPESYESNGKKYSRYDALGYGSDRQKYYMTGSGTASVYACNRFLLRNITPSSQAAYDCCKKRSQNAICIENSTETAAADNYKHVFCEIGSKCDVQNVSFETYASKEKSNYVCARTYSVCPYNHNVGGGTEEKDITVNKDGTTSLNNYCQYMKHCSKIPILPYVKTSKFSGEFISSACYDMKGDSQNVYGYTSQLIPINTRGFSAPMAQCFKETMENIFLNKVGYSQCLDPDETPDENGVCDTGYRAGIKEGAELSKKSFFLRMQDGLQNVIKVCLIISITFFGYMILVGVPGKTITKKEVMPYILKIGLVMYFAVGDGWQFGFMKGVLGTSSLLSDITFNLDEPSLEERLKTPSLENKLDGCQFPRFNYADNSESTKYKKPAYEGKNQYLRIWDTLDCKIARALGYGPEVSVPNLIFMILGGFFTGGLGVVFFVAALLFGFFMIAITVRALHIFLLSTTAVIILMYVSPITITLAMFKRTKSIFDGWWKQLLGFTLQPMILFAYLGIMLSIFDRIVIGDATFSGDGTSAPKIIVCNSAAQNTSIYCIFKISDIKTYDGFEALGIGLPMLGSMNSDKLKTIIEGVFVMYILLSFLDQITGFASKLVGGMELKSDWGGKDGMADMVKKTAKGLRAIQSSASPRNLASQCYTRNSSD